MRRSFTALRVLLTLLLLQVQTAAAKEHPHKILIADPYIELHTGPGAAIPSSTSSSAAARSRSSSAAPTGSRFATERGVEGWVPREQMIADAGADRRAAGPAGAGARELYEPRWQAGVIRRRLRGASLVSVFGGYASATTSRSSSRSNHILGEFSNGYSATLGLMHVFVPEWRISPYFTLGTGIIYTEPKSTLVQSIDRDDQIGYVGGGLQFYLTRRFMLRTEYRNNVIFTSRNDNEEVDEWKYLGFAFFF
jgi:opacity protein-like surface antigen